MQLPFHTASNDAHMKVPSSHTSDCCISRPSADNTRVKSQQDVAEAASDRQANIFRIGEERVESYTRADPESAVANPDADSVQAVSQVDMPQSRHASHSSQQPMTGSHGVQPRECKSEVSWLLRTEPANGCVTTAEAVSRYCYRVRKQHMPEEGLS